jgi:hypothetical protein
MTAISPAYAEALKADAAATEPIRDPLPFGYVCDTPRQQFRFNGDGPYYEFHRQDYCTFSAADALNFFAKIGATVIRHDRRSWIFSEDGSHQWYDCFIVEWRARDSD